MDFSQVNNYHTINCVS